MVRDAPRRPGPGLVSDLLVAAQVNDRTHAEQSHASSPSVEIDRELAAIQQAAAKSQVVGYGEAAKVPQIRCTERLECAQCASWFASSTRAPA